jgi:hypothetical protein
VLVVLVSPGMGLCGPGIRLARGGPRAHRPRPPSTTRCSASTPRPARSRRTWASPWTTCARYCAAARCPGRCARSGAPSILAPAPASSPPGQQPGVLYLDTAWLREEYLTWRRALDDIAAQIGCPVQTLNRFAHDQGIPVGPAAAPPSSPPPQHPAATPVTCPRGLDRTLRQHADGSPRCRPRISRSTGSSPPPTWPGYSPGSKPARTRPSR